jgi:methylenetetrahydrofolate dehydrogenase (NADP+)/methenyltetrahydrofolate cyclohydrolase/formyltetrahydrofolate synthetase
VQSTYPRFQPQLAILQAGERPDSTVYVRMKAKAANEVGIQLRHIKVPLDSTAEEIVEIVRKLNEDEQVSGILVQLPLGDHIQPADVRLVTEAVSPEKDVDG